MSAADRIVPESAERYYCYIDDKLFLKASVYDAGGVTADTPVSGTITIYNDDDDSTLVDGAACSVGAGYCQYYLTDTDEAGRYVAYMTVVVDASLTETATFVLTIREKES